MYIRRYDYKSCTYYVIHLHLYKARRADLLLANLLELGNLGDTPWVHHTGSQRSADFMKRFIPVSGLSGFKEFSSLFLISFQS